MSVISWKNQRHYTNIHFPSILSRGHQAWALYTAWWGQEIIQRTIRVQSRSDGMDDVDTSALQTIIEISQSVDEDVLGEMLLRREFLKTRNFIQS